MLSIEERNARLIASLKQALPHFTDFSHDIGLPTKAVGHFSGIMTSTAIIRSYRKDHRRGSQHVEPQTVIEVLQQAQIKRWHS